MSSAIPERIATAARIGEPAERSIRRLLLGGLRNSYHSKMSDCRLISVDVCAYAASMWSALPWIRP